MEFGVINQDESLYCIYIQYKGMITVADTLERYLCLWIGQQTDGTHGQDWRGEAGRRGRSTAKIAAMLMIEKPAASRNA